MTRILIGTSSWTDPTLLRSGFYPPWATTAETRLRHYASNFRLVEADSSYYALPSENNARLWCQRTPDDFTFDIKAFSLLTNHPTQVRGLPKEMVRALSLDPGKTVYYRDLPEAALKDVWQRFASALLPLDSCGKLGLVMFQFPPWFRPGKNSREHILLCQGNLPQYRLAVEFRASTWMSEERREDTLSFLRDHNLTYVCVDEPQGFTSSVPPVAEATSNVAVVRLHGRNPDTWEKKGVTVAERFKYLYSKAELEEWLPRMGKLVANAREMHVLFNNCYSGYGVRNARDLDGLLRQQPKLFPDYQEAPAVRQPVGAPG